MLIIEERGSVEISFSFYVTTGLSSKKGKHFNKTLSLISGLAFKMSKTSANLVQFLVYAKVKASLPKNKMNFAWSLITLHFWTKIESCI